MSLYTTKHDHKTKYGILSSMTRYVPVLPPVYCRPYFLYRYHRHIAHTASARVNRDFKPYKKPAHIA